MGASSVGRNSLVILLAGALLLVAGAVRFAATAPPPGSGEWIGGLSVPGSAEIAQLRLTRIGAGLVVGAALGLSGAVLQIMLRNPLASPEVLGASSGAGLAVMLFAFVGSGASTLSATAWRAGPAMLGALAALTLVLAMGRRRGVIDPIGVILMGIVVSIICGAGVMLLQSLAPHAGIGGTWRLLAGELDDDTRASALIVFGVVVAALGAWALAIGPSMDAATLGDDEAWSVGVRVGRLRLQQVGIAGAAAAIAVTLAGPVAFVGLIAPHITRLIARPPAGVLACASALTGGAVVVLADALVRIIDVGAGRLPLGVLTSLVGGPLLLVLLRRELRGGGVR